MGTGTRKIRPWPARDPVCSATAATAARAEAARRRQRNVAMRISNRGCRRCPCTTNQPTGPLPGREYFGDHGWRSRMACASSEAREGTSVLTHVDAARDSRSRPVHQRCFRPQPSGCERQAAWAKETQILPLGVLSVCADSHERGPRRVKLGLVALLVVLAQ